MLNRFVAVAALAVGGVLLSKQLKKSRNAGAGSGTSTVEEAIEVNVPVSTAYNQWTQFEDFPKFMDSVREVRQLDDTHLRWRADVAGKEEQWDAEITEQIPDKRIAWRSIGGVQNSGVVTFHKISDSKTRIMLQMDYVPQSADEKIGDMLGFVKMQLKGNLNRFKELLESRGAETGAWRGSVPQH
ncbi:MAG: cyclase [Noviherbaspirillum sp.]|jgi:uncharacterized membrane protein|nr:cyclase [Noviherbaspirillum sp.]